MGWFNHQLGLNQPNNNGFIWCQILKEMDTSYFLLVLVPPFFEYMATCEDPRSIQGLVGSAPYSIEAPSTRYHGENQPTKLCRVHLGRETVTPPQKKKDKANWNHEQVDEGFDMSS